MSITGVLVSAGTATTNPSPNSLVTVNPFPSPFVNRSTVSTAWTTQAQPALFPANAQKSVNEAAPNVKLSFVTSVTNAAYTVTMWIYNRTANVWIQPKDNASFTLTGNQALPISDPGEDPIFLQLSSISSGTVSIYYDPTYVRAA